VAVEGTVNRYRRWAGGVRRFRPSGPSSALNRRRCSWNRGLHRQSGASVAGLFPDSGQLLQLRVLCLGLLQDGDVEVGVFPKGKENIVSGSGARGLVGR
jgi:hypothetical protein